MSIETFSFRARSTDADVPLQLTVWINDQCVTELTAVSNETLFSYPIEDIDQHTYKIRIEMSGKTDQHTKIDEQGNIVKDVLLEFSNFELMGIDIGLFMHQKVKYRHNHNGHSEPVEINFAMNMGCNGTVEFEFTTPAYLWLLENL